MRRSGIAVAAYVVAVACCWQPAQGLPQGLPSGARAAARAPLLQPVRYHRYRRYYRHYDHGRQAAADAAAIRPGQWEFAAQLEAAAFPPAGSDLATAAASASGGAMKSTYAICVAADNAVPSAFAPGCKIDALHRDGGRITWSMTCTNRQNSVRSDGIALYRGDTMEATMVSHLPNAKGGSKTTDVAQHITGHYRGTCLTAGPAVAETEAPVIPPAAPEHATRQTAASPAPPAAGPAVPETEASAAPPTAPVRTVHHRRYRRLRRHYAYRRRWYGGYYGGGYSGFGPSPYSANGY